MYYHIIPEIPPAWYYAVGLNGGLLSTFSNQRQTDVIIDVFYLKRTVWKSTHVALWVEEFGREKPRVSYVYLLPLPQEYHSQRWCLLSQYCWLRCSISVVLSILSLFARIFASSLTLSSLAYYSVWNNQHTVLIHYGTTHGPSVI